jgi:quercetin dioxygenase-like cupin family protein
MVAAQQKYAVKPIIEMKIKQLPKGELFWRIENFPTVNAAKAAAPAYRWNPDTVSYDGLPSMAAEIDGKAWLFTLGPKGGATAGGTKVAEIGPVPPLSAPEYLLRVNYGHGLPGSRTPVHTHPGSETFYVLSGRLAQRTPQGVRDVDAGHTMNGHPAGTAMEVFNSGSAELKALIMFVVDATKPFSVPAKLE